MTDTTTETRDLIARVRAGFAPTDQPQALRDLARTADGEPRVDAEALRREAEIIEIRQCIERADRHGRTNSFGDDRTLLAALDAERAENDRLRARVAELEAERATARREGAEAMRERAAAHLDMLAGCASLWMSPQETRRKAAAAVRALPLDDGAREDAQGGE